MSFIEEIKTRAKQSIKTIILPEAEDIRTLEAAETALNEKYASIVLIGNKENILKLANTQNIKLENAIFVDPKTSSDYNDFVIQFYELRKAKGMTEEKARELMLDPVYFGMMMVKNRKS